MGPRTLSWHKGADRMRARAAGRRE